MSRSSDSLINSYNANEVTGDAATILLATSFLASLVIVRKRCRLLRRQVEEIERGVAKLEEAISDSYLVKQRQQP